MRIDEILKRLAEIRSLMAAPDYDDAQSEALLEEVRALNAEKAQLEDAAARTAELRKMVGSAAIAQIEKQERGAVSSEKEVRSSDAYAVAYVKAMHTGDLSEVRALLTTGASGGQVPVPTSLENEIRTAWEANQLLGLVKHSYFKGTLQVGFELSATGASIHVEGAAAPEEEVVTLGVVTIPAQTIKKWITVSTEAMENVTVDVANYIYAEIAQKIAEYAESLLVAKINAAPAAATATAVGVPVLEANAIAAGTLVEAVSLLSGSARDLHIAMNRQTYPAFVAVAMAANYAIDVFDGLKDRIVFTEALPAFAAASSGAAYAIVGDFGRGAQANFPAGDTLTMLTDPYSLAEKDLVKVVGRMSVGIGIVADRHFVKIAKG